MDAGRAWLDQMAGNDRAPRNQGRLIMRTSSRKRLALPTVLVLAMLIATRLLSGTRATTQSIVGPPDLLLAISALASVGAGQTFSYTLTVHNRGAGAAANVYVESTPTAGDNP